MNSDDDSVFLETSLVTRGDMPRNRFNVGGIQLTRRPILFSLCSAIHY